VNVYLMLNLLSGALSILVALSIVIVVKLQSDVKLWRDSAMEYRDCWHHAQSRANWLRTKLDEELKRQKKDGPYR
jgi:alpha-N-acetylglucosamine transferase